MFAGVVRIKLAKQELGKTTQCVRRQKLIKLDKTDWN